MAVRILRGDVRERLRDIPDESVHCVVTSPPYWGLRDYGHDGQIGLESSPQQFMATLVDVFREVRRVLREDGTLWLNLGDSYAATVGGVGNNPSSKSTLTTNNGRGPQPGDKYAAGNEGDAIRLLPGLKPKNLVGIPWRVAFALQSDGWYLRQDIIWSKPNPMPESVRDRCTKAHEYIFLLAKSERYYYDQEAILEPAAPDSLLRLAQPGLNDQVGSDRVPGKTNGRMKAVSRKMAEAYRERMDGALSGGVENSSLGIPAGLERNKRSVWTVTTQPFKEAHFATFPPALIEPCILAGCPPGGVVLDPFGGAGTTGLVADRLQRDAILIELNPEYADMAERRIRGDAPLFAQVGT